MTSEKTGTTRTQRRVLRMLGFVRWKRSERIQSNLPLPCFLRTRPRVCFVSAQYVRTALLDTYARDSGGWDWCKMGSVDLKDHGFAELIPAGRPVGLDVVEHHLRNPESVIYL